jgi:hypothetical protein
MRATLALLLVLAMALVAGCGQAATSEKPAAKAETTKPAAEKVDNPITITPDPGPLALKDPATEATIDTADGVDQAEAAIVGGFYLRALRQSKLADAFGTKAEAFALLNQVKVAQEWLLTYSRTTVNGQPAEAYAATICVDTKTGKQTRYTEAP